MSPIVSAKLILTAFLFSFPYFSTAFPTKAFSPHTFPDSLREWFECGSDHVTLVCDPDKLLNDYYDGTSGGISALGLLDAATRHIRRNSECICDTAGAQERAFGQDSVCQQNPPLGFAVSVAVLGKMEVSDEQRRRYRSGAHLPAIFANELRNRLQRGQCADDVLIVLAINDSSIRTSTGGWAATKLDAQFILNVSQTAQARFFSRSDYTGGLLYMLDEYGRRLGAPPFRVEQIKEREAGGWWDTDFWPLFPEALRQSEIRWFWLLFLLLLLLALILLVLFCAIRMQNKKRRHSLGYHLGQRTKENGKK